MVVPLAVKTTKRDPASVALTRRRKEPNAVEGVRRIRTAWRGGKKRRDLGKEGRQLEGTICPLEPPISNPY